MFVRSTKKLHPEFDLTAASQAFAGAGIQGPLTGEQITSPYDLHAVETLRERHGLREGRALPTDVFVFGKGEPPRPDGTKIGGIPYWPVNRPWPVSAAGTPCLFLAQFNFADSRELFPDLPGDVLLLFVEDAENFHWEPDLIWFEWMPLGLDTVSRVAESLTAVKAGPFYGVIHRSADYPDASDKAYQTKIAQSYNLPVLNGTKIGGVPHFIQGGCDSTDEFLCQLSSIQAEPNVPYPWVNQAEPLGLVFDDRGIYDRNRNSIVFGDMGSIYIFCDRNGNISYSFECY